MQAGCVSAGNEICSCYLLRLGVKQLWGLHSIALMTLRVIEGKDAFITGMLEERDGEESVGKHSHS